MIDKIFNKDLHFHMTPERRLKLLFEEVFIKKVSGCDKRYEYRIKNKGILILYHFRHYGNYDWVWVERKLIRLLVKEFNIKNSIEMRRIIRKFVKKELGHKERKFDMGWFKW